MGMKNAASDMDDDDMKGWKAESDLRTLIEAEKIRMDDKRLKAAMVKRSEMKKALDGVKA